MAEDEVRPVRRRREQQGRAAARSIRRERLIKAAAELLEGGAQSFSTNAVMAKSGVAIGSSYKLFRNKDALLLALLEQEGLQFAQSVGPFAEKGTWPEAAERLTSALITYYRSRPRMAAALLIEEQRLRAATPRGVLTITDDAVFAILEHVPTARYEDWTIAARYLSAMLCSMGVVAGQEPELADASAQAGMQAALLGYIRWYGGPQR